MKEASKRKFGSKKSKFKERKWKVIWMKWGCNGGREGIIKDKSLMKSVLVPVGGEEDIFDDAKESSDEETREGEGTMMMWGGGERPNDAVWPSNSWCRIWEMGRLETRSAEPCKILKRSKKTGENEKKNENQK